MEAQYSGEIFGCHLELSNQRKVKKIVPRGSAIGGAVNDDENAIVTHAP